MLKLTIGQRSKSLSSSLKYKDLDFLKKELLVGDTTRKKKILEIIQVRSLPKELQLVT